MPEDSRGRGETRPLLEILNLAADYLGSKGIPNPRLDSEVLLGHVLGMDRVGLYVNYDRPLNPEEISRYRQAIAQRAGRMPVAYITGTKEFMSLPFEVNRSTLIPRPETELLVEVSTKLARRWITGRRRTGEPPVLVDVGTGSGVVAVCLARNLPDWYICATDRSREAIEVARRNAVAAGVADRVKFMTGDLLSPLVEAGVHKVAGIVSNPPYIPTGELSGLAPELGYEPVEALDGGQDGLSVIRRLIGQAARGAARGDSSILACPGFLALEVGTDQARVVAQLCETSGLGQVEIFRDYAGAERVVAAWKNHEPGKDTGEPS